MSTDTLTSAKVTIRQAGTTDVPKLVEMGVKFLSSPPYSELITPDPDAMVVTATRLIEGGGVVLVATVDDEVVGMLGLALFAHPISGLLTVAEVFWWVDPTKRGRAGLKLLREGEEWARNRGASTLHMIAPTEGVERLYTLKGYRKTEVSYQKEL